MAQITETKCTCKACGNIWFFGKREKDSFEAANLQNAGKALMCCSGCAPAVLIPTQNATNPMKCPKCGSEAVSTEEVVHDV